MDKQIIKVTLKTDNPQVKSEFKDIIDKLDFTELIQPDGAGFADVLVMELTDDLKKDLEFIKSVLDSKKSKVFLTSSQSRPEIILQTMRMGISDFFPQPLKKEEIERAFERIKEEAHEGKKTRQGKVISVLGAKGGSGVTTVATNLATSLSRLTEENGVGIIDLNVLLEDVSTFLDLSPRYTIAQFSESIERLDLTLLTGFLTRHPYGIYLLSFPDNIDEISELPPDGLKKIVNIMRTAFDFTIVDIPHSFDPLTVQAFELSNFIFVVITLDVPSLRNARRLLDMFCALGYSDDKIKIVVNRYAKGSEISLKDVEAVLKCQDFWIIPNDYPAVISSINQGKPLSETAAKSEICNSFEKLALMLTQGAEAQKRTKRPKFLGYLLRRKAD